MVTSMGPSEKRGVIREDVVVEVVEMASGKLADVTLRKGIEVRHHGCWGFCLDVPRDKEVVSIDVDGIAQVVEVPRGSVTWNPVPPPESAA